MGEILAGAATSHAFAFADPLDWDRLREANRQGFKRRYDFLPQIHPAIAAEDDGSVRERYARVANALRTLEQMVQSSGPTALVIVGDDQNENFLDECVPQIAVFVGDEIEAQLHDGPADPALPKQVVPYHRRLAEAILDFGVSAGFDISISRKLRHPKGLGHAFGPPLRYLTPDLTIPIVCVAVNALHLPAPSPRRCLDLGRMLRQAIAATDEHVVLYGSGGLSHYSAGFPYRALGRFCYGEIDVEFDRRLLAALETDDESFLAGLTSRDLLEHGDIEFRSWLAVHGAMPGARFETLAYEPFYRGIMGVGCAVWHPNGQASTPASAVTR